MGRETERAELDDVLAAAADEPALLLLTGEAGIGKSRLCAELLDTAREQGWRCLSGRAVPMSGGELPWAPWTEVLRGLARSEGRPGLLQLLGDDVDALAPLLPLRVVERDRPAPPQAHVLEALLSLVERLAEQRPLAVALEDLHWADAASLDALAFLVRNLPDVPVLLAATARSDDGRDGPLRPVLAELRRDSRARSVELSALGEEGTAALAAALGAAPDAVAGLHARSGGNPFYVRELLAAGDRPVTHLQDAVLVRVDDLPLLARRLLEAMAVAGRPVPAALLAAATSASEQDTAEALRALDARRLLTTTGAEHAPVHDLAASAVLSRLLPGERAALHRAFADALVARPELLEPADARLLAVAEHRAVAGGPELLAAAVDVVLAAPSAAAVARWGRVALEQPSAPAGPSRGELLARTAEALLDTGSPAAAADLLEQSLQEPDAADPAVAGARLERLAQALWADGRTTSAEAADARALALLPDAPGPALARAQASSASTLMVLGRWAEAETLCRAGLLTAATLGATDREAHLRSTLGVVLVSSGREAEGLAELERSCELARGTGDVRLLWRNLLNHAYGLEAVADAERSVVVAQEALALARRHGRSDSDVRSAISNTVSPLVDLGRWDEAADLLRSAPAGPPDDPRTRRLLRVSAALSVERGEPVADGVLHGAEDEPRMLQQLADVQACRALWSGDTAAASSVLRAALAVGGPPHDRLRLTALALRAAADALALPVVAGGPDSPGRAALLEEVASLEDALPADADRRELGALVLTCRAEAARARGAERPEHWRAAVEAWDALGRPYSAAVARWRLADALPERAAAASVAREAHEVAVRLGAEPLRRELELLSLRRRLDLAPPPAVPDETGPAGRPVPDRPRAAGPRAALHGCQQPAHQPGPAHQREHRRRPRLERPAQAGRGQPHGGDRGRPPARPRPHRRGKSMSGPRIVLPSGSWELAEGVAEGLADRLQEAADARRVERVPVLGDDGSTGELLVAPAVVPVVVLGSTTPEPAESFPER